MIHMQLSDAARHLNASWQGDDVGFHGLATDSRTLNQGALFVALHGPSFDGHDFIDMALNRGATAVMVDKEISPPCPSLKVADTRIALGQIVAAWRQQFSIPLVAVTGSNGKTTVKEMLAHILGQVGETLSTTGNLNNDIGLPLSLSRLGGQHRFVVLEMGANHEGEIDALTIIAAPTVALITQCAPAHLEGFGSVDAVARAKGEIFLALGDRATAVINNSDAYAEQWREMANGHDIISFAIDTPADVYAENVITGSDGCSFVLCLPDDRVEVKIQLLGRHNVMNALAAAACAHAVGVDSVHIATGLAAMQAVPGRLQCRQTPEGTCLIDDSYNANPGSLRAAIQVLSDWDGECWMVLGDMGELGDNAAQLHAEIGELARAGGVTRLYSLGDLAAEAASAFGDGARVFSDIDMLTSELKEDANDSVCILVKGSRSMHLERVVSAMTRAGDL